MAIVRQMSELYLRGSLANVTMANLNAEEQNHVAATVDYVTNHTEMVRHKSRFLKELGGTIGADYADDRLAAEEEYNIAIWRAVVNLLYHRKYTFQCEACGSGHYLTKRKKPKAIDRQQIPCPNCDNVRVVSAGDTELVPGSFITHQQFQDSYREFLPAQESPKCESAIKYISGEKAYENPDKILKDPRQLVKFFGEFLWNYFRQTLKENERPQHRKKPQKIYGPADCVIVEELLSLCTRMKIEFHYCSKTQPENGKYSIRLPGMQTPPEFTIELAMLNQRARQHNIIISHTTNSIDVLVSNDAPSIEAFVTKPEHVLILDTHSTTTDESEGKSFVISQVCYRTVRMDRMKQEDHVELIDAEDVMVAVRRALPDGDCQKVFDIWAGQGDTYLAFSNVHGDGTPCTNHIARFLGITTRAVNQHKDNIKLTYLAHTQKVSAD